MNVILLLLIAANILGVAIGLFVYSPQIFAAHPLFWVFIPDCPLYVLLAALFYLKVLKNEFVRCITAIGLVKYGIWTISILFSFSGYFLGGWFGWLLVLEHIGMTLQFVLLSKPVGQKSMLLAALGWFLLNDFVDYGLGMHPYFPSKEIGFVAGFTVVLSFASVAFVHFASAKMEKNRTINAVKNILGL